MRLDANNTFTGIANVNGGTLALNTSGSLSNQIVNTGKSLTLPGHPASMRGRTR